ncbi:dirigent protein 22-like [Nymphaea colorata]|nr:dirigent protein 22-like [Nymphaea colorata]
MPNTTMDRSLLPKSLLFFMLFLFITTASVAGAKDPGHPLQSAMLPREEKVSRFRFYLHDVKSGKNPTSITIINGSASTPFFGKVQMIDSVLTEGPELTSKQVGRCQGFYAYSAQQDIALLMDMNVVFTAGRYNGSTLSFMGRNSMLYKVREIPVVGGSGAFRMAQGYALVRTHWKDNIGDVTVQYDVVVVHQ